MIQGFFANRAILGPNLLGCVCLCFKHLKHDLAFIF